MSEFRVGDKVVVTRQISLSDFPIGKIATITELEGDLSDPEVYLKGGEDNWYCVGQLELESIYNSPLRKALR